MSGDSTHGVGAALCAPAALASAVSATAAKIVFVENPVIRAFSKPLILVGVTDGGQPALEQTTNAIRPSIQRELIRDFVISRFKLRGYLSVPVSKPFFAKRGH